MRKREEEERNESQEERILFSFAFCVCSAMYSECSPSVVRQVIAASVRLANTLQ